MAIGNGLDEVVEWYSNEDNFKQELEWMEKWLKEGSVDEPERITLFLDIIPSLKCKQIDFHIRTRANTFLIEYAVVYHDAAKRVKKEGNDIDYNKYETKKKQILGLCGIISPNGIKKRK